jgi:hypothetical protein
MMYIVEFRRGNQVLIAEGMVLAKREDGSTEI